MKEKILCVSNTKKEKSRMKRNRENEGMSQRNQLISLYKSVFTMDNDESMNEWFCNRLMRDSPTETLGNPTR